jgi:hypothetical protein
LQPVEHLPAAASAQVELVGAAPAPPADGIRQAYRDLALGLALVVSGGRPEPGRGTARDRRNLRCRDRHRGAKARKYGTEEFLEVKNTSAWVFNARQTGLDKQQALALLACYREGINAHLGIDRSFNRASKRGER